eukprot:TRINITY_DN2288_c0_g1_i1.p1 TRINITY_DN2288_c0_g1~~TRINITY_DN2288_c0_g1_i1.p1  ORF type:complete len:271 (-),score=46.60 TRINITY_DN2288_c0_g1_i1:20-832(-)
MSLLDRVKDSLPGDTKSKIALAGIGAIALLAFVVYKRTRRSVREKFLFSLRGTTVEKEYLKYIKAHAEQNPESVIKHADDFCYSSGWMMNVGDMKGKILDNAVLEHKPKIVVELGTYCGYSSIRTARLLEPGAKLYTFEVNPESAKIALQAIEHAKLNNVITVILGSLEEKLDMLKSIYKIEKVDLLFIDHWKELYLPDLQRFEKSGLLQNGSVVVADNIYIPGAPEYLKYVQTSPKYKTELVESFLEYSKLKDAITISIYQGEHDHLSQ